MAALSASEIDPLRAELDRKSAQLAAMREISRAIAEAWDLDTTLDLITRRATEVMGVDSCSIYLYDEAGEKLVLAASTGLNQAGIGQVYLPAGAGLTGWAAQHRQVVVSADATNDPRFYRVIGSGESRFATLMAMPLVSRDKVIGAANVQTATPHNFGQDKIELFSLITDLAATALEKAQLVHAAVVREMHHRVKNNLQTIAMLLRLQVAQSDQLTPQDILHETINRVLSIAAVHEILSEEEHTQVGLKELVERVARTVTASMTVAGAVSVVVSGEDVRLSSQPATSLALIANELLQNALEHGLAGQKASRVEIHLAAGSQMLCLTVTDNGRGLPADFNLERDCNLGLEIVQTMVREDMKGAFTLGPASGRGTLARVEVPLRGLGVGIS
ncbi:MAG: GAF domain-containing protein [Anaerolineae bacterium]